MKTREQALIVRRFLRRPASEGGEQTRVFAKLWLAEYEERGIRLTADEVAALMADHAVEAACDDIIYELDDVV